MRRKALRCAAALVMALMCAVAFTGCIHIDLSDRDISLFAKVVTLSDHCVELTETPEAGHTYRIAFEKMVFTNTKGTIKIIYSETPSIQATVSEELVENGFAITVKNGVIRIGTSRNLRLRGGRFDVTVYAPFNEIALGGGYEVEIDAAGAKELELSASGVVNGGVEKLDAEKCKVTISGAGAFSLSGRAEEAKLQLSGAGELIANDFACKELEVKLSGAAAGKLENLAVEKCKASISGAGEMTLSGTARAAELHISGAGEMDAARFTCNELDAHISGAGSIVVSVVERLDAEISGAGSVEYYGDPQVNKSTSGAASVKRLGAEFPGK